MRKIQSPPRGRAAAARVLLLLLFGIPPHLAAAPVTNQLVSFDSAWRYATNSLDDVRWTDAAYDDATWMGPGSSLFFVETAALPVAKRTPLPLGPGSRPRSCYAFRTRFTVTNAAQVVALRVQHLVDDGAVFYLNGNEVQRVRMAAGPVTNATLAFDSPPGGDATNVESFTLVSALRSNLVEGVNVLAASVHQNSATSSDVVFGAQVSAVWDAAPDASLTRGPYLMVCTTNGVTVRWRTDFEEDSRVRFGASPEQLSQEAVDSRAVTEHQITLSGLAPDTTYYYSVGSALRPLAGGATCRFRTHPVRGADKPLRIWLTGDPGTANANEQAVVDAFEAANGGATVDAWLQLGDNAYDSGTDAQYQAAIFDLCASRLRQTPVWPTLSNHDTYSVDWNGLHPYFNIYVMPTLGQAGGVPSGTNLYYSFDIGMAHVISLDAMLSSRASSGPMANWLRADLAATTSRWVIAIWHHPPYTKGSHDSDSEIELVEMRQNILPIIEAGGVDLVLSGHSHCYERSYLLDGHYGLSSSLTPANVLAAGTGRAGGGPDVLVKPETAAGTPVPRRGAVYVVAGSSGKTSGGSLDHPAMSVSLNELGSVVLDITTNRITAVFLRETGATNDWFAIDKANFAPVAADAARSVAANAPTAVALQASDPNRDPVAFTLASLPTNGLVSAFDPAGGTLLYTPARGAAGADSLRFTATDGRLTSAPAAVALTVAPPVDADADGMPDDWELANNAFDPHADPDHDGADNLAESIAGTNPRDAGSWLRVTACAPGQTGYRVTWASSGGVRYRILYRDGLASGGLGGPFTPLPRAVTDEMDPRPPGVEGTLSFVDDFTLTAPPATGCRLYRVQVVQ